ncbi:PIN domain-containing protein [Paenibacillus gallinarum]|uniref:Uncharacterized protein n=1 Tax=Paenibacillus gallinarum TaxID=2762232 RepID=A0ABR8SWS3_9BACL|nr:hypothetical protein [Paenibacillus gallinarum]MBD7967789.1 hypothetical protein [Paenibacillus gallinarum]
MGILLSLIKSAKSLGALEKVKTIITNAYHGKSTVLGDYIYISDRTYGEIMSALKGRMKELDESHAIIDAFKDFIL